MKKIGLISIVAGSLLFSISMYDLFGEQIFFVPLTAATMILGLAGIFSGPAIFLFPLQLERRKKITNRSLIISLVLIFIGLLSTKFHWAGARVEIIFGVLILSFFYGTLAFKIKYEKWKIYARSKYDALFLSSFDFIGVGALFLGYLFKFQLWPYADAMILIGFVTLTIGVLAWNQKFKKEVVFRKETEDKLKESLAKIETQHEALEEKQKEIISSIRYAKRIQNSLLPTEKYIDSQLKRLRK